EPDTEKGRFGRMDINGAVHYNAESKRMDQADAEELGEAVPLRQMQYTEHSPSPAPPSPSLPPASYGGSLEPPSYFPDNRRRV
ncbi:hypothetical protein IWW51_004008, partial [Coemansia sp. RSA 2702]